MTYVRWGIIHTECKVRGCHKAIFDLVKILDEVKKILVGNLTFTLNTSKPTQPFTHSSTMLTMRVTETQA